jgi:hypothetical protein
MKEGEYTPGPWSVKTLDGYIDAVDVQDSRGMSVAWCAVSHQFGKDPANIGPREVLANATLIAQAPLLLAAMKNLLAVLGRDEDDSSELRGAFELCDLAILKAERKPVEQ